MSTTIEKNNPQSMGEEIANAISHGIGALLAIGGTAVMIVRACFVSDAMGIVSASLYGFSLIVLYVMSTLYHSLTNKKAKYVFQIFDHCSIFILIMGTYIPVCLSLLRGPIGWILFGINMAITVVGIVLNSINMKRWHSMSMFLYIIMGWSVIFAIKPILSMNLNLPPQAITLIVGGGLLYTIGVIFYKMKKYKFMHSVWHLFVLGASVLHYFFVLFYALPV